MGERTPRERLIELAESWECGAKLEGAIVDAFQALIDEFAAGAKNSFDIRLIRGVLDARDARDRFLKDAAAVRTILDELDRAPRPTPPNLPSEAAS